MSFPYTLRGNRPAYRQVSAFALGMAGEPSTAVYKLKSGTAIYCRLLPDAAAEVTESPNCTGNTFRPCINIISVMTAGRIPTLAAPSLANND